MDLTATKKTLAEKQAIHDRVAAEMAAVREKLSRASQVSREAQLVAREKAVDAVLKGTDEAKAEAAKAKEALTTAFEQETALKDQIPALDHALGRIRPELIHLREGIKKEEDARILEAVRQLAPLAVEQLRDAAAKLVVVHCGGQGAQSGQIELGLLLEDKAGRLNVFARAEEIRRTLREQATGVVQP